MTKDNSDLRYSNWLFDVESQYFALFTRNRLEIIHADSGKIIMDTDIQSKDAALMLRQTQIIRSGHVYIGNKVLRMRYDLIVSNATQDQIDKNFISVFDWFFDKDKKENGHN